MIHDTIKQRLRASLLLAPPPKAVNAAALHHAASLQKDGTWNDLSAPDSPLPRIGKPAHLERTLVLAKALRPAAGALDDPLRRAFDHWLSNDFTNHDWRRNQIIIPRLVGEIALLSDNGLSAGAAGKVTEILARSRWADWSAPVGWVERSGMDLLGLAYNHLLRGCLENTPSFFDAAFMRIFREIRLVGPGEEGIQADMTFHTSGGENVGGGFAYLRECAQFLALAHGTPWQAPAETVKLFASFVLDGQQWMMRQGIVDTETHDDVFSEAADLNGMAAVVQQLAQLGNPPRRAELAAFAHRLHGKGEALSGHRYFWRARMSVHQRPAFYISLRLATPVSDDDKESALPAVADGQSYLLRSGREYHGIRAEEDKTSGATTYLRASDVSLEGGLPESDPARWLSGGVSEGEGGLAVTELKRPGLSGKKSWFFFDESVVCLGTGLYSALADHPVHTTINRCRPNGPVAARLSNGESCVLSPGQEHALRGVRTVEHDGISYVFPDPPTVLVQPGHADDTAAAFSLQIDHGSQLKGASWTCIVVPTGDDSEPTTPVADEVGRIQILANTAALQAVRHRESQLLGVAFWEPGVVPLPGGGRVAANHACLLLCREIPGGGTRLSISNPGREAATVHVEYGGQCVCFELPGGPDSGRSMSRLL